MGISFRGKGKVLDEFVLGGGLFGLPSFVLLLAGLFVPPDFIFSVVLTGS